MPPNNHWVPLTAFAATVLVAHQASAYCDYWGCYDEPVDPDPYDNPADPPPPPPPAAPPPDLCDTTCSDQSNYNQGCVQTFIGCSYGWSNSYCDYSGCYPAYDAGYYNADECPAGYEYPYTVSTTCGAIGVYDGWSGPGVNSTPPATAASVCQGSGAGKDQHADPPKSDGRNGWFSVRTNVDFLHDYKDWKLKVGAQAKVNATLAGMSGDVILAEAALESTVFGGAEHKSTDDLTQAYVRLNVLGVDVWRRGKMSASETPTGFNPPKIPVQKTTQDKCAWFQDVARVRPDEAGKLIRQGAQPRSCSSWPVVTQIPKVNKLQDLGNLIDWAQNMTFFQGAVILPLGPGTVNLNFSAGGKVSAALAMAPVKPDDSGKLLGGTFGVSPSAGVWIGAGISVNFWIVAAGVNARVNLITASYNPTVTALFEEPDNIASRLNWDFDHYVATKALDGYVEPWLRLLFVTIRKKFNWGPAWEWSNQVVASSPKCAQATCNNGACDPGETYVTCPSDCAAPPPPPPPTEYCGDWSCSSSEIGWCTTDCGGPGPCNNTALRDCALEAPL